MRTEEESELLAREFIEKYMNAMGLETAEDAIRAAAKMKAVSAFLYETLSGPHTSEVVN